MCTSCQIFSPLHNSNPVRPNFSPLHNSYQSWQILVPSTTRTKSCQILTPWTIPTQSCKVLVPCKILPSHAKFSSQVQFLTSHAKFGLQEWEWTTCGIPGVNCVFIGSRKHLKIESVVPFDWSKKALFFSMGLLITNLMPC